MRQDEILMLKRLTRRFQRTNAYEQEGELVAEVDVWIAEEAGQDKVAKLLEKTLEEEKKTDEKLTKIAESRVNKKAAQE